ncbi:SDR family NAD(P)-dependent oxidoreductase, partial [uncultured Sphingomonas sp.]|uniref:SDR family NAD(P)-dependent oxidoreductase n=1 Tax=uncultured Sphingomonas sp. TaxID=158754 RepID=UPI0025EA4C2C
MPTVLITGATSGIGKAAVEAFADSGWHVVATGRRADRLEALKSECVHTLAFDIRDDDARDAAIDSLEGPFAEIDLLINNAGLALGLEPAQKASL